MHSYTSNATFRQRGREALRGKWGTAILLVLIVSLLGSIVSVLQSGNLTNLPDMMDSVPATWQSLPESVDDLNEDLNALPEVLGANGSALVEYNRGPRGVWSLILTIGQILIGPFLALGLILYFIRIQKGDTPTAGVLFARASIFLKALGLYFMIGVFSFLWSLVLLIPLIILMYFIHYAWFWMLCLIVYTIVLLLIVLRYSLAPYLMAEQPETGILAAIDRSKQWMRGNQGRLIMLRLSFIGWALLIALASGLLGMINLFLGSIVATLLGFALTAYTDSSVAAFYLDLRGEVTETAVEVVAERNEEALEDYRDERAADAEAQVEAIRRAEAETNLRENL